jgi:thioredoxin 2
LAPLAEPLEVDERTFDEIVSSASVPVLVDFWAPWCGPCRMVAPEVKKAAERLAGKALVLKVNTEQHPELAGRFAVQSIPTFAVFSGGRRLTQQAGAMGHERLLALVAIARTSAA